MAPTNEDEQLKTVTEAAPPAAGTAPLFVLRIVKGKDTGKTRALDWNEAPVVLVGQSRACELVLADPRVSRRHLSFAPEGARLRVTDLGSSNGTKIGGVRMLVALLEGGEQVEIGDTVLRIVRAGEQPAAPPGGRDRFGAVLGRSHDMQRVLALAERLAASALPVLLEGETGTGKELLAEAMHDASPRAKGPFVVVDCASAPSDLDARIASAAGGTLVLANVAELPPALQTKVLGAIDRPDLDVRWIATTRRDLDRDVQDGAFREELSFRLTGARVELPPLRRRHGDVELLARHFWQLFGGASEMPKAIVLALSRQDWPGNVRELQHAVARAVTLGEEASEIMRAREPTGPPAKPGEDDFIDRVLAQDLAMPRARQAVIEEFEQRYVERALAQHGGNVSRAAAASGLTRRYFHMLLAKRKT